MVTIVFPDGQNADFFKELCGQLSLKAVCGPERYRQDYLRASASELRRTGYWPNASNPVCQRLRKCLRTESGQGHQADQAEFRCMPPIKERKRSMLNDPAVLILMYFILPVWLLAGSLTGFATVPRISKRRPAPRNRCSTCSCLRKSACRCLRRFSCR